MSKYLKNVFGFLVILVYRVFGSVPLAGVLGFLVRHSGKLYWLVTSIMKVYAIISSVLNGIRHGIKTYGMKALYVITVCVILFMLVNMVLQYGAKAF